MGLTGAIFFPMYVFWFNCKGSYISLEQGSCYLFIYFRKLIFKKKSSRSKVSYTLSFIICMTMSKLLHLCVAQCYIVCKMELFDRETYELPHIISPGIGSTMPGLLNKVA